MGEVPAPRLSGADMSSRVFPTLAGLKFPVKRTPVTSTRLFRAISGKRTTIANWTVPLWRYEGDVSVLRTDAAYSQPWQNFVTLFEQNLGQYDTFLYDDPTDDTVVGQSLGVGTGSQTAFQLLRALLSGGFLEPILAPHVMNAVYLNGVSIPTGGLSAPGTPALSSVASGSLGGATYYVKTTYVTASGETLGSVESNLAVAASHVVQVASPGALTGATGWNVYVSTSTNTETRQNGATPIAIGTPWTEPTSGLVAGANLPNANTTGWTVSLWGTANPGILTFGGAPANSVAITADFTYYWPCAFEIDQLDMSYIYALRYAAKSVKWVTVK